VLDRVVTRTRTLAVAALLCLAVTVPAARANDVFPTSWGGISFSESDRDLQAAADAPGLAVDPNGTMVATLGLAGGRTFAYRFDPSGPPGDIGKAAAVAVDAAGHVFVADSTAKRVEEFDPSGALVRTFGSPIANPTDVGVDGAGGVYVADAGGQGFDVRKFAADGTYLGVVDSGFFNADSRP